MSTNRNFRITINLSSFFHDHRNRARIFINDDIATINDLQDRIKKIFYIDNFHLTSQNEFLPPSEDVRILRNDDIIWKRSVSPAVGYYEEGLRSPKNMRKKNGLSDPPNEEPKKKRKKKKIGADVISEENIGDVNMEGPKASLKHKKIKEAIGDENSSSKISTTLEAETKRSTKSNVMKINTLLPVLQSHISTYNKKISNQVNKVNAALTTSSTSTVVKEAEIESESDDDDKKEQYSCKGNLSSYKKSVALPTITDQYLQQKKVNIVKIEYVVGGPTKINGLEESCKTNKKELLNKMFKSINTDNQNPIITEDQGEIVREKNMTMSDGINSDLPATFFSPSEAINVKSSNEDVKVETAIVKIREPALDPDQESPSPHQNATYNVIKKTSKVLPTEDDPLVPAVLEESISTINGTLIDNLEKTFLLRDESLLKDNEIKDRSLNNTTVLRESNSNKTCSPHEEAPQNSKLKGFTANGSISLSTSTDNIYNEKAEETPGSTIANLFSPLPHALTAVVNRKYDLNDSTNFCTLPNINHTEKLLPATNTVNIMPAKESLENSTYDIKKKSTPEDESANHESKKLSVNVVPSQLNEAIITISEGVGRQSETSCVMNPFGEGSTNVSGIDNSGWINLSAVRPKLSQYNAADDSVIESLPSVSVRESNVSGMDNSDDSVIERLPSVSVRESNDFVRDDTKYSKNPLDDNVRDSISSAMDLSKAAASNFSCKVSTFSKRKQLSGVVISVESEDSDCSQFVTKRHRKRSRRRNKKKVNADSDSSINSSSLVITNAFIPKPKPINVKACPLIHIKFEEEECGGDLKVVDKIGDSRNTEEGDESYAETSCIENITIDSNVEESKLEAFHIQEAHILKSPSMSKMLPKVGDFIAFKILRITESYTPEISSYIIGKVLQFNSESQQVTCGILSGLDQCDEPKGKLSLDVEEGVAINKTEHHIRVLTWVDLIDPRLLFP
ncbi:hypothetical protein NQ314_019633 [Rhamnusium bicolor]|uniref:Coilin n=1 Tax=Rhamnusium bicolor TaxID=1586634 RepID=A0AAV8WN77_9CUCU|nr:hypothetical protein NQ314_019633 [Rhamnusium bicolor]